MSEHPNGRKDANGSDEPEHETRSPRHQFWRWFILHMERKMHQVLARRKKKKTDGPSADRAARKTATATIWMAVFTFVLATVSFFQLRAIHNGSKDTHDLATAAANQAVWTQRLAANTDTESGHMKDLADRMKDQADRTKKIADQAVIQASESKVAAGAARSAAETAKATLEITNRPWLKINIKIIEPLTFDASALPPSVPPSIPFSSTVSVLGSSGPFAAMTTQNTIENVGSGAATDVLFWEDIIPMDEVYSLASGPMPSTATADARLRQYCNSQRHTPKGEVTGVTIYPHDAFVEAMRFGPLMSKVDSAIVTPNHGPISGKAAFVLVGCLWYRSTFEPNNDPNHQTRFLYWLGVPREGVFNPFIFPSQGPHPELTIQSEGRYKAD